MNYAYRNWDDPYFWRWYVSESGKIYKFIQAANGVVTFERVG
jgi:hypothetical protein